ncbi:MAG: YggT family protein [Tissierellia bacterium]|nr:YggT family protein [Tissierellia bacterium]
MRILYRSVDLFFYIIELLILTRIILSFLNVNPYNTIGRIVYELTEPVLAPARELIHRIGIDTGMLDFSPIVSILMLRIVAKIIRNILFRL